MGLRFLSEGLGLLGQPALCPRCGHAGLLVASLPAPWGHLLGGWRPLVGGSGELGPGSFTSLGLASASGLWWCHPEVWVVACGVTGSHRLTPQGVTAAC